MIASPGTSSPSAADTFLYLMREPVRESSWLKLTFLRDTAAYSLIGMLTRPKLIDPLQMALGIRASIPNLSADEQGTGVGRLGGRVLIGGLVAAMVATAACSSEDADGEGAGTTTTTPGPAVGLDEIQVLAAHNAYHLEGEEALLQAIDDNLPALTPTIEYSHPTLTEQLDLGLRSMELDVYEDPDGGRYAAPKAQALLGLEPIDPVMAEPGFKVFHIQEVDYRSSCLTFVRCLEELESWSDAHPGHLPIIVQLEAKDGEIPDPLNL